MRKLLVFLILAALLAGAVGSVSAEGPTLSKPVYLPVVSRAADPLMLASKPNPPPTLSVLKPGGFTTISQTLPVNIVMVGFEQGTGSLEIDQGNLLADLPAAYDAINRYPYFYGLPAKLGLHFDFNYNLTFADTTFENAFFSYMDSLATEKPLTLYQDMYNTQINRTQTIDKNYWVDAPSIEQWLAANTETMLGVDTQQYTIFFINWYGQPNFKYHVLTKTDEPDPDTGYNFGELRASRKLTAWGGTTPDDEEDGLGSLQRIWFYDLSAGPEGWSDNWNLDDSDLFGDGVMDYRIPPAWEYGNLSAYRPFDNLSGDLAKVARYVGIDLLFTTSPLYKPAISPPELPNSIQLDINVYQGEPGYDGKDYFQAPLIDQELGELLPYHAFSTELTDADFTGRAEDVYECWFYDVTCFGNKLYGIAFGDLFLYHNDHLMQFLEGDADYEIPIFAYNTTDDLSPGLLGYADDNWEDGTQSFVFGFDSQGTRDLGYGFTTTFIHEVGHHLGMSHPHDGYDAESDVDFSSDNDFQFAWVGDMSNSMMSYIDLNWDFSQFDRDNMNRYMTVTYINQANVILAKITKNPKANQVSSLLAAADANAGLALSKYASMDYSAAVLNAKSAYQQVLDAAKQIKIKVEPQAWQADYKSKGKSPKFVDEVDYQRSKP